MRSQELRILAESISSLNLITDNGIRGVDLYYVRHEIREGKYTIPAMPAAFDRDSEAETLSVILKDSTTGLEAELLYGVYENFHGNWNPERVLILPRYC